MTSTTVLLLSSCILAVAVAQPSSYACSQPSIDVETLYPGPPSTGPWISIGNGVYQIVVNAKGYQIKDLSVVISGGQINLKGDVPGKSFSYSYSFPRNGNAYTTTAVLTSNGYLVVRIPLTGSVGNVVRIVPITPSPGTYP